MLHDQIMRRLIRFSPVPFPFSAGLAFIAALSCPSYAAPPSPRDASAVLAPLVRDDAAHARLAGEMCVYDRLWPTLDWDLQRNQRDGVQGAHWEAPGDVPRWVSSSLAQRLDRAFRSAMQFRPASRTRLRLRSVPSPLRLIRGRQSGRCNLTIENPISQADYSRPAFGGEFAFVVTQYLVWGTNPPPILRALQHTPRGWIVIAKWLAL